MLAYDGGAQHIKGYKARHDQSLERSQDALKTFERMKASGLNAEIFSGGGTGTYNIMTKVPGYTDVQVGSYVFMDAQYLEIGNEKGDIFTDFAPSLTVMTTVVNTYFPNRITTDAGTKALTLNKPDPIVIGEPGFRYTAGSDEFGIDSVRHREQDLQGGRQARADHSALRSGRERVRRVLRRPKRQSRGGMARHGARQVAIGVPLAIHRGRRHRRAEHRSRRRRSDPRSTTCRSPCACSTRAGSSCAASRNPIFRFSKTASLRPSRHSAPSIFRSYDKMPRCIGRAAGGD